MLALNLKPDAFTWCGLLTAYGRGGEYERAMELYEEMVGRGVVPNRAIFNAALLACQGRARWQRGLQLVWEMEQRGIAPDVVTYSTLIKTCQVAGG